jgi:hypothetical protein
MASSNITGAMRDAVGRQLTRRVSFPVAGSDIRRWAIAVYYPQEPPRRFWDEAYAKSTRYGGIVAPEDFNPFAWMAAAEEVPSAEIGENDPDQTELMLGIPGAGLKFQLNGGMEVAYGAPIRPGDVITSVNRLSGYTERQGRLGLMLFTVMEDSWANQDGDLVKRTSLTLIRY